MIISPTQQPPPRDYVDAWERGLDPWHADAFIGTPAEGMFERDPERKQGWYALDWCGNVIGFIPDGTEIGE